MESAGVAADVDGTAAVSGGPGAPGADAGAGADAARGPCCGRIIPIIYYLVLDDSGFVGAFTDRALALDFCGEHPAALLVIAPIPEMAEDAVVPPNVLFGVFFDAKGAAIPAAVSSSRAYAERVQAQYGPVQLVYPDGPWILPVNRASAAAAIRLRHREAVCDSSDAERAERRARMLELETELFGVGDEEAKTLQFLAALEAAAREEVEGLPLAAQIIPVGLAGCAVEITEQGVEYRADLPRLSPIPPADESCCTPAADEPCCTAAAGEPCCTAAAGEPCCTAAASEPCCTAAASEPCCTAAADEPCCTAAADESCCAADESCCTADESCSAAAGESCCTPAADDSRRTGAA